MRQLSVLFWVLGYATWVAAGCGDDATGGNNADTGDDTADGGGDTSPDADPDATPDATPDTTPDGTPDTEPDQPVGPELCEPSDCVGDQACVGGECVDPVDDLEQYADEAGERPSSYFWSIQLPNLYPEPERCCFDYNGDPAGNPDDGLGSLLALVGSIPGAGDFDIQATLDTTLADGTITLVTDWRELPASSGDVKFSILLGDNDVDADGALDAPFADLDGECTAGTRCGGDGGYLLEPVSFGTHGSQVQFNVGSLEGGIVRAGPSTFELNISISALGDEPLSLTLEDALIEAAISVEANGVATVDEIRNEGTEDAFFVAGGKLGGVIDAAQILTVLDDQFRGCGCAFVDPDLPVLAWEIDEEAGALIVSCTENTGNETNECDGEGDDDGPLCGQISTVCSFAGFIGNVLDVDRDNDGINESLSAGLRFALAGASIEGLVVEATTE